MDRSIGSRTFRRTYIGGGDAAAIAGVSPWGSPYSLWQEKVGVAADPVEPSERMTWGTLLEETVAHEWARREGVTGLRKATFRRHPERSYVGGHPDYTGVHPQDGRVLLEVKTSDRIGDWQDGDGDRVPLHYLLQVQHYLMLTGIEVGYLAVLLRGNELRSWRIPADPELQTGLLAAYDEFWRMVEERTPPDPDGHEATAEALRRQHPRSEPEEIVADLPALADIDLLLGARRRKAEAEALELTASNRIKARLGTAERLLAPGVTITWRTSKDRTVVNWEAIARGYQRAVREAVQIHAASHDIEIEGRILTDAVLDQLATLESLHTDTLPGARPFRVTIEDEEVQG